jgi:hypothetical protein
LDIGSSSSKEHEWNLLLIRAGAERRKERSQPVCSSAKCVPNVDLELGGLWQRREARKKSIDQLKNSLQI